MEGGFGWDLGGGWVQILRIARIVFCVNSQGESGDSHRFERYRFKPHVPRQRRDRHHLNEDPNTVILR